MPNFKSLKSQAAEFGLHGIGKKKPFEDSEYKSNIKEMRFRRIQVAAASRLVLRAVV